MDASKPRGNRISREGRAYFKALGRRIARLRGEMSQGKLGQILGVTEDTVAAIERGERRPPLAAMPKLAAHFGVSMNDLVDDPRPCHQRCNSTSKGSRGWTGWTKRIRHSSLNWWRCSYAVSRPSAAIFFSRHSGVLRGSSDQR